MLRVLMDEWNNEIREELFKKLKEDLWNLITKSI